MYANTREIHTTTGNKGCVMRRCISLARILSSLFTFHHPSRSRHPARPDSIYLAIKSSVFLNVRFVGAFVRDLELPAVRDLRGKRGSAFRYWDVKYSRKSSKRSILLDLITELFFLDNEKDNWLDRSDHGFTSDKRNFQINKRYFAINEING